MEASNTVFYINVLCYFFLLVPLIIFLKYKDGKSNAVEQKAEELLGREKAKELFIYRDSLQPRIKIGEIIVWIIYGAIGALILSFIESVIANIFNHY